MAKKHRVKRQKYVDLLLKAEREREAYLAKQKKRGRETDGEAERAVDEDESQRKKRRVETTTSTAESGTSTTKTAAVAPVAASNNSKPVTAEEETTTAAPTESKTRKVGAKMRRY